MILKSFEEKKIDVLVNNHQLMFLPDNIESSLDHSFVHEKNGNHVLQRDNKFLICEEIEEGQLIES